MIDAPTLLETPAQSLAVIHVTVPRAQIREVMGPGIQELLAAVTEQGAGPTAPWYTHHLRIDPEVFDFEICVPVRAPVRPTGRVRPGERPALKVARALYRGPYEGLGSAWETFDDWIVAQGLIPGADLWERYLVGPESGEGPAQWCTELERTYAPRPA